ncbi:hypothetical protein, partial [Paenibacillus periandrae]|uniref:hypothetical protein n=1 Tax=Paenibacillus periandrae TaxID=1761741 RepID=UPI001F09D5C6
MYFLSGKQLLMLVLSLLMIFAILPSNLLHAEDYSSPVAVESFESGSYEATSFGPGAGIITNDPQKVITGQYSAYAEAAPSQYWQEFSI